jgi:integrase
MAWPPNHNDLSGLATTNTEARMRNTFGLQYTGKCSVLRLAGLNEALTPHSLRHTHTSLLAEAGVGIHEIMERLGHQDDEITKRVYLHVTKTMKKEASQKFSDLTHEGCLIKLS